MPWEIFTGEKKRKKVINRDFSTRKQAHKMINELREDYGLTLSMKTRRRKK